MAAVEFSDTLLLPSHGRLPSYYWRGVWYKDNRGERAEDQAADLGHSRARALQGRHPLLLPRGCRGAYGLRHHQVQDACYVPTHMMDAQTFLGLRLALNLSWCTP